MVFHHPYWNIFTECLKRIPETRIDRRKESSPDKTERRLKKERRYLLIEQRSGWTRDTKWSGFLLDLLR